MRRILVWLLLIIGVTLIAGGSYRLYESRQVPMEPLVETLPETTTTTTTAITTTTSSTTIPAPQGDFEPQQPAEEEKVVDLAEPVTLDIDRVGISATIDNVDPDTPNSCGRYNDPCFGKDKLDAWTDNWGDKHRVGVCEAGASFITGHTTSGKGRPDTFTNLIDDWEFDYDTGVVVGDKVKVTLADGSICNGVVVDFDEGPGEKLPDSPARYIEKALLRDDAAIALTEIAGDNSVGFLMTSYCGPGPKCEWYSPQDPLDEGDRSWHRRYTAVVMVLWEYTPVEELLTGIER